MKTHCQLAADIWIPKSYIGVGAGVVDRKQALCKRVYKKRKEHNQYPISSFSVPTDSGDTSCI